ncbi:hypothetical protein EDC94DRAFT_699736 [Helicostylum pulchrum]|nr:hypothetical protein EDC94DRAFT_699736 [Helicostylum pulchrum]
MTCREFPSVIKYLVYEHVLDQTLSSNPAFINPLIVELKNRLPSFSITKASQNKDPFGILPALRHILSKYESLIAENSITQMHNSQPRPSQNTSNSSNIKKGKDKQKFVPPRLFSLFPNPGLRWRFVKIDSQNVTGTLRRQRREQESKNTLGVTEIETNISTPKTTSSQSYLLYITYMFRHMDTLFNFYSFRTAAIKWSNYVASQRNIENAKEKEV